jgi:hypothetical protein
MTSLSVSKSQKSLKSLVSEKAFEKISKITFVVSLLSLFLSVCAMAGESSDLQEAKNKVEAADQKMERFNNELIWFFDDKDKGMLHFEKSLKERGTWESELLQNQELKIKIVAARELFKQFRAQLGHVLSLPFNTHASYSFSEASVYLDTTSWFVSYVEEQLFPQGWKEAFEDYEKKSGVLKSSGG